MLVFLITSCTTTRLQQPSVDVVFIAYDQGESNAFKPLESTLIAKGISYNILAIGRAAEIFASHPRKLSIPPVDEVTLKENRKTPLSPETIKAITRSISPFIVYTGMASTAQAQLANAFKKQGSYSIAFYDNFDSPLRQPYLTPFLEEIHHPDEFHVPSVPTSQSFAGIALANQARIIVTGQPALESWDEIYKNTNETKLRRELGLNPNDPVVLFAGGYDDGYEQSFRVFMEATKQLPDITFLVTHHPKYSGQLESRIINAFGSKNVRLIPKEVANTASASKLALAIATHKSTVGAQALYKGKPVIYIAAQGYSNFLIEGGLADRTFTPRETAAAIKSAINKRANTSPGHHLGMPAHPLSDDNPQAF